MGMVGLQNLKRRAPKKVKQEPIKRDMRLPRDAQPVCLVDAEPWHCRFVIGEPNGPHTIFCGAQVSREKPYCPFHCKLAYTKIEARA